MSRRQEEVERLRKQGVDAVYLDLDNPESFASALAGVDRAFLSTGYTVAMLSQSKVFVDAAHKAGLEHIVHLGVFADWDCTALHFTWHQLVERYIESSGICWTHLHPAMFMENLLSFLAPKDDILTVYWQNQRMGWVAASDIAAVAAEVLTKGPRKHHGKNYWMSTEALDGPEMAEILSEVTGRSINCKMTGANDAKALFSSLMEPWYANSCVELMRQLSDGRMASHSSIRNDVPYIIARAALTLREWAKQHRDQLITAARSGGRSGATLDVRDVVPATTD
jgi:uncharacterized protein YbjT (DUF2867 family)